MKSFLISGLWMAFPGRITAERVLDRNEIRRIGRINEVGNL